jgi:hypothetical protein
MLAGRLQARCRRAATIVRRCLAVDRVVCPRPARTHKDSLFVLALKLLDEVRRAVVVPRN